MIIILSVVGMILTAFLFNISPTFKNDAILSDNATLFSIEMGVLLLNRTNLSTDIDTSENTKFSLNNTLIFKNASIPQDSETLSEWLMQIFNDYDKFLAKFLSMLSTPLNEIEPINNTDTYDYSNHQDFLNDSRDSRKFTEI